MSSEKQKSREAYRRATNPSLRRIDSSDDDEDTKKQKALEKAVHGFSIPRNEGPRKEHPLKEAMQEKIQQEKERAGKAVQDKLLKLSGTEGRRSHRRSRSRSGDRRRSRSRGGSPDSSSSKRKRKYEDFHPHLRWTKKYDRPLPQALIDLCEDVECKICGVQITSMVICEQHYAGSKHNKKVAAELEQMFRATPGEYGNMPKKLKTGITPTITGQTESFLASLAGTMEVPLTPRQEEQREMFVPPLPLAVLKMIREEQCDICGVNDFTSECHATAHYQGAPHSKKLSKLLEGLNTGQSGVVHKKRGSDIMKASELTHKRCGLCQVDFTGPAPASMHYAGAKHKKKLAEANRNGLYMMGGERGGEEVEDRTFGIGQAFHQLSQADKERMEEVGAIEAMLKEAKAEAVVEPSRQTAANLWGGLTEQDISLYNQHEPEREVSPYYCNVCQRDCESAAALDSHLKGKPHMKKVKAVQVLDTWQAQDGQGGFSLDGLDPSQLKCEVCNVKATNLEMMQMHILTKKHQHRSKNNGLVPDLGYNCEVCNVSCSCQDALEQHMAGAKHAKKLRMMSSQGQEAMGMSDSVPDHCCEICNVNFHGPDWSQHYQTHMAGAKHAQVVYLTEMQQANAEYAAAGKGVVAS